MPGARLSLPMEPGSVAEGLIEISGLAKSFGARSIFGTVKGDRAVNDVTISVPKKPYARHRRRVRGRANRHCCAWYCGCSDRRPEPSVSTARTSGRCTARDLKAMRRQVQPIFQNPASSFNPRQSIQSILSAPLEVHGDGDRDASVA